MKTCLTTSITVATLLAFAPGAAGELTYCGDCNDDGRVDILDALVASQHAVALVTLGSAEFLACNVNGVPGAPGEPGAAVDVLDALFIAQRSAGLAAVFSCSPLDVLPPVMPPGEVDQAYSFSLIPQGGTGVGYSFALSGGALPMGVTLDPSGLVSGIPTVHGGFFFTVDLTDQALTSATREYLLDVRVPQVYLAYVGDEVVTDQIELRLVDISGPVPGVPFSAFPMPPAWGDIFPTWSHYRMSADGRYIAYLADYAIDETNDLYVIDLLASPPVAVQVTNTAGGGDVRVFEWSPDSLKIATCGDLSVLGDIQLAVIDLTAGIAGRTTTLLPVVTGGDVSAGGGGRNDDYAWSLDSTKLYFSGDVLVDGYRQALMLDLGNPGAGAQPLSPAAPAFSGVDTVFASGSSIALFVSDQEVDSQWQLYAVDTTGGTIGAPVRLSPTSPFGDVDDTRVAPGGRFVSFVGDFRVENTWECWVSDLRAGIPATGSALNVSNLSDPASFDVQSDPMYWSPRGDGLVFLAEATVNGRHEALFVDLRGFAPAATVSLGAPVTTFEDTYEVRWAPNGSGVTLSGDYVTDAVRELFYVDLAGRAPGPLIQLSAPGVLDSDVGGEVAWLPDSSGLVYRHDQDRNAMNELFLATPPAVMSPVKINAPYPADTGTNFIGVNSANSIFVTSDGQRVLARGEVFVDNDIEVLLIDLPTAPNLTRVNGPLAPGSDIDALLLHDHEPR